MVLWCLQCGASTTGGRSCNECGAPLVGSVSLSRSAGRKVVQNNDESKKKWIERLHGTVRAKKKAELKKEKKGKKDKKGKKTKAKDKDEKDDEDDEDDESIEPAKQSAEQRLQSLFSPPPDRAPPSAPLPPRPLPRPPQEEDDKEDEDDAAFLGSLASPNSENSNGGGRKTLNRRQSFFEASAVLDQIADLQLEDGSWKLDAELARVLGIPDYRGILHSTKDEEQQLLATSVVLSFLIYFQKLGGQHHDQLIARANDWLTRTQRASVYLPPVPKGSKLKCSVVGARERVEYAGTFVVFQLNLQLEAHRWTIFRRWDQCIALHTSVKKENEVAMKNVGSLPPQNSIEDSDAQLKLVADLLANLLQIVQGPQAFYSESMQRFFSPQEVGDLSYDGNVVNLPSLMDAKWSSLTGKLVPAVPPPLPNTTPLASPVKLTSSDEQAKGEEESLDSPASSIKKKITFWEKMFSKQTPQIQYVPPKLDIGIDLLRITEKDPRSQVAYELYTTEHFYSRSLEVISKLFMAPMRDLSSPDYGLLSEEEIKIVFPVINELLHFHKILLKDLESRMTNWTPNQLIGDLFVKYSPFFKIYSTYCKNYDRANTKLHECLKKRDVAAFFDKAAQHPDCNQPDIQSYLIQPVQRLPRLMLLLQDIAKKTKKSHADHNNLNIAMEKVTVMMNVVNESIRSAENAFQFWQKHTEVISPFMEAQRQPIRKGKLRVKKLFDTRHSKESVTLSCMCFLFNDLFVISHNDNVMEKVELSLLWTHIPGNANFTVLTPEKKYMLSTPEYVEQLQWSSDIKDAIDRFNKQSKSGTRVAKYTYSNGNTYEGEWFNAIPYGKGTMKTVNGTIEKGEWSNGKMDGRGSIEFVTGDKYEGHWENGLPHGKGTLVLMSGSIYSGDWNAGKKHGQGKLSLTASRNIFMGTWENNVMEGYGELSCGDGAVYKGNWKGNKRHGIGMLSTKSYTFQGEWEDDRMKRGKMKYSNKDHYEGQFLNGQPHAYGIFTSAAFTYDGEWKNGLRDGKGAMSCKTGDTYDGDWVRSRRQGKGTQSTAEGIYEGDFLEDCREGSGSLTYRNGDTYVGGFKRNQRHGKGIFNWWAGSYDGDWTADAMEGEGILTYTDGRKYLGSFRSNLLHGNGIMIDPDGSKYEGEWVDGVRHGKGVQSDGTGKYSGQWQNNVQHGRGTFLSIVDGSVYEGRWVEGIRDGKGTLRFTDGRTVEQQWTSGQLNETTFGQNGVPVLPALNFFSVN